jgi:hypothetical protein
MKRAVIAIVPTLVQAEVIHAESAEERKEVVNMFKRLGAADLATQAEASVPTVERG